MQISKILSSGSLWARGGYVLLMVLSIGFLVQAAWPNPDYFPVDFKYFWLSGTLWREGIPPYGPELEALGKAVFPGVRINPFFYPPSWRFISILTALASPDVSRTVWAALSALSVAGTAGFFSGVSSAYYSFLPPWRIFTLCFAVLALLTNAVEIVIIIGQPTLFLALTAAMLLWSVYKGNAPAATIALTLMFLKPQLSIGVAAAALFIPFLRRPLAFAIAATLGLAAFGLGADHHPVQVLRDFLYNLSLYGAYPENFSIHMSGLNYIAFSLFWGWTAAPFMLAAFTGLSCAGACLFVMRNGADFTETETSIKMLGCSLIAAAFIMPTHNSDLLVVMPAAVLLPMMTPRMRVWFLVGLFLIMRSISLSLLLTDFWKVEKTVIDCLLDTIGILFMLLAAASTFSANFLGVSFPKIFPAGPRSCAPKS